MKLIDKERFEAFEYVIPSNVDEESFGLGVETVLERIDNAPIIYPKYGKWEKMIGGYMTPGGTPIFICAQCGGSEHLHGAEFPRRKMICDDCGCINSYPWEKTYEDEAN